MRILITTGATRESIDSVRFLTNGSSGRMGVEIANAAAAAGHTVTLLAGKVSASLTGASPAVDAAVKVVEFITFDELKAALDERFDSCDVLVMAAAVGDFRPVKTLAKKIRRADGPVTLTLVPTEDILAGLGKRKKHGQIIIAFAVEEGTPEQVFAKARAEMAAKNGDYVVVNRPEAMGAPASQAAILSPTAIVLPWGNRPKSDLARAIIELLGR